MRNMPIDIHGKPYYTIITARENGKVDTKNTRQEPDRIWNGPNKDSPTRPTAAGAPKI